MEGHADAASVERKIDRLAEGARAAIRGIDDPRMATAQDNLGVALSKAGRFAEALVEARKAVALSPRSAVTRGNLAATLCACGMIESLNDPKRLRSRSSP